MTQNNFFAEPREQSLIKARIVEKYFWAWAKVMIGQMKKKSPEEQKIAYIDLLAGTGIYQDGSKSTPVKVLEKALSDSIMKNILVSIFNDADQNHVKSLKEAIKSIPNIESLKYTPKILNLTVGEEIARFFSEKKLIPTLFFIDPFGYKGLSLKLIGSVLQNWGCDCIFFFNFNRINMDVNHPNSSIQEHINALFGENRAQKLREQIQGLKPQDRELTIVENICEALKEIGGEYPLPFRFKDERGTRTSHHLIFVTKHIRGYEIMKEIMAKESSEQTQGVASFEYNPATSQQPLLFEFARPLDDLESMLLERFAGKTMTMKEVYEQHHVGRSYISKNYKDALGNLESQGKISADPPASKRPKRKGEITFADKVKVTFSPKL
jgi:three-Cys-motif partner protein